jgi:hypothetical protein
VETYHITGTESVLCSFIHISVLLKPSVWLLQQRTNNSNQLTTHQLACLMIDLSQFWLCCTQIMTHKYPWNKWAMTPYSKFIQYQTALMNWTPHHKDVWWSGGTAAHIRNLIIRWRGVVIFTPKPLYPQENSSLYSLDRRLHGRKSWSGHSSEQKNPLPVPEIEPWSSSL